MYTEQVHLFTCCTCFFRAPQQSKDIIIIIHGLWLTNYFLCIFAESVFFSFANSGQFQDHHNQLTFWPRVVHKFAVRFTRARKPLLGVWYLIGSQTIWQVFSVLSITNHLVNTSIVHQFHQQQLVQQFSHTRITTLCQYKYALYTKPFSRYH